MVHFSLFSQVDLELSCHEDACTNEFWVQAMQQDMDELLTKMILGSLLIFHMIRKRLVLNGYTRLSIIVMEGLKDTKKD